MMGSKQRARSDSNLNGVCISLYNCTMFPIRQFGATAHIQCARSSSQYIPQTNKVYIFIPHSRRVFIIFSHTVFVFLLNFFRKLSHGWHDFIPSCATFLLLAPSLSLTLSLSVSLSLCRIAFIGPEGNYNLYVYYYYYYFFCHAERQTSCYLNHSSFHF